MGLLAGMQMSSSWWEVHSQRNLSWGWKSPGRCGGVLGRKEHIGYVRSLLTSGAAAPSSSAHGAVRTPPVITDDCTQVKIAPKEEGGETESCASEQGQSPLP